VFKTVPPVLNDTTELVADEFVRLNGDPGGVQFCPAAAGPAHPAAVKTPTGRDVNVNLIVGSAVNSNQSVRTKGLPTGCARMFRSLMVPEVPARPVKVPVCVKGSTPKLPVPVPTGRKSMVVEVTATDPVVFKMPVIGVACNEAEFIMREPARTAAVRSRLVVRSLFISEPPKVR
jgi:hypothetical protein